MRKLVYVLENGTKVNTMNEAKNSGQPYTTHVESIAPTPGIITPIRKKLLNKYGYVSPKLV